MRQILNSVPVWRPRAVVAAAVLGAAVLAGVSAPPPAAASPEDVADLEQGIGREEASRVPAGGPLEVFAAVESAWAEGDAQALMEMLDPREKIGLSFRDGGPRGGWFNRDQAFFLLKDQLEYTRAERFEFEKYWNLDAEGRSPYAVAVHSFRRHGGTVHTDRIYISLRRRDDQWFVGEIRSLGS